MEGQNVIYDEDHVVEKPLVSPFPAAPGCAFFTVLSIACLPGAECSVAVREPGLYLLSSREDP